MKLRWGICTAGMIANDFLVGLSTLPREEHTVVAIAEARVVHQAQQLAKRHGIGVVYDIYEDLATDPNVDIVYVAAVNQDHLPLSKLFLNHGKHVLCEKPLALNKDQCTEIIETSREKGVFFMEGWWSRFFPAADKLRHLISDGVIGEVKFLQGAMGVSADFKERLFEKKFGGGILLDNGPYLLNLALMVFGQRPVSCSGKGFLADTGVDETCVITMLFPNKAAASLSLSMTVALPNEVNIQGTKGHIKIPAPFWSPTRLEVTTQSGKGTPYDPKEKTEILEFSLPSSELPQNYPNAVGMRYEGEAVRQCIMRGEKECSLVRHEDSIYVAELTEKLHHDLGYMYDSEEVYQVNKCVGQEVTINNNTV
ncbi:trans-1,2-dihydrobenzene-1,2-diol dehydrogenase-like [Patiria miniata]|uniref:Trans-1,2-dihydrobenzene-1,2-diol dehydrogenase n=1 Tax=Patiria miniata TaxID=46514 RepID=A0A914BE51_PATMI|nr:trans-1,2-dihydrobenzene-1,2-diol dehydrogenase-like [Patiria miniata]